MRVHWFFLRFQLCSLKLTSVKLQSTCKYFQSRISHWRVLFVRCQPFSTALNINQCCQFYVRWIVPFVPMKLSNINRPLKSTMSAQQWFINFHCGKNAWCHVSNFRYGKYIGESTKHFCHDNRELIVYLNHCHNISWYQHTCIVMAQEGVR